YSTRNLWQKAIRKFCLQNISDKQIEEIVFSDYSYMMEQYEKDKILIPQENLVEIEYEELETRPLAVLKKVYTILDIPGFESAHRGFIEQLQKELHYNKFNYEYDNKTFGMIDERWGKYIRKYKYRKEQQIRVALSPLDACPADHPGGQQKI